MFEDEWNIVSFRRCIKARETMEYVFVLVGI